MHIRAEQDIMKEWANTGKPTVSVCCATYNQQRYIEDAIRGFLIQETDFPFEIIIHDDASTDNTTNIVKQYAQKYPNIIYPIYQKENQYSQGKKILPKIFEIAQGDYLAICEGDDYWTDPQKLQIQTSKMKEHPGCHISFHAVNETMNDAEESLNPYPRSKQYENEQIFDPATVLAGGGSFMQTPSVMIHKESIKDLPYFYYTAPATDYVLQFLASLNGGALYINRNMAVYRVGADGSWRKSIENVDNYIKFQMAWFDSYLTINRYFDGKYEKEIISVLRGQETSLAKALLSENRIEEFKKFMNMAYAMETHHSFEFSMMYYFRSTPRILNFLLNILNVFYKMIAKYKHI